MVSSNGDEVHAMFRTMRAVGFLIKAPFIVVLLFFINLLTSPGQWWFQWAAFGIGIAWFISLFRVLRAAVVLGGIAALAALWRRHSHNQPSESVGQAGSPARFS